MAQSAEPADERTAFHALPAEAALARLDVDPAVGLSAATAAERLERYGPNRLGPPRTTSARAIFLRQLASPIVWLLLAAAAVSAGLSDWLEAAAIGVVLAVNTGIGFATELRAVRSMEALRSLGARTARLLRDGRVSEVPAEALTPGDIVLLEAGDAVPADLRILRAANLAADESTLTGESVPVDKQTAPVAADAPVGDRASMLFKGASVTRGSATAAVVATGLATELGRIATLVEQVEDEQTPLERRLERLTRRLIWATLGLAALVIAVGVARGRDLAPMAEAGIALAVAAIPEGLPVVATLAQARGMLRMASRNA
ncbi:MAG: cation-transporting P-type ATPase, partial [Alphaproteobacteria bacterium]